jgi:hypothetical protein
VLEYGYCVFRNPPYKFSRHLMITRIASTGTAFSPLPCQAWHGYKVSSANRVEVEVGSDGHASAPPSGAAAVALPAGAPVKYVVVQHEKYNKIKYITTCTALRCAVVV